jgi:hypothetical protein
MEDITRVNPLLGLLMLLVSTPQNLPYSPHDPKTPPQASYSQKPKATKPMQIIVQTGVPGMDKLHCTGPCCSSTQCC